MLAFSIMILFVISSFTLESSIQELRGWSLEELEKLKTAVQDADRLIKNDFNGFSGSGYFGNETRFFLIYPFSLVHSDFKEAWGRSSCYPRLEFDEDRASYFSDGVDIGTGNASTDIEARNGVAYLTADSTSSTAMDFFIVNANDASSLRIMSSLNTGPGINAIEIAGPYAFAAQASSVSQLQIIDMHDRTAPQLISQLRLPLPTPTTTAPFAVSVFYSKGFIYLGTAKWSGPELAVIDVSNINNPSVVGTFETNTVINDIYVRGDKAYLATADEQQMMILDVSDKSNPLLEDSFSSSGWQTQTGKTLEYFEGILGFGRTVGGFNVTANHEVFTFSSTTQSYASKDIPGGVYGLLVRSQHVFLLTHFPDHEFQVWDPVFSKLIFDMPLDADPARMSCAGSILYFATGDSRGISLLKLYE